MHNSLAFSVLTRKTLNLNVSLSLQFEASLCYFWSFNLIATKEPFFSDCISGDVSAETVKSAEEDSKVETGPENGLFWSRRLDRYSTISTILNFQCETAREVPLRGMRSMLNLDTFSWQESPCKLYIYIRKIYIIIYITQMNWNQWKKEIIEHKWNSKNCLVDVLFFFHLLLSNLWKTRFNHKFFARQVLRCRICQLKK